MPKTKLVKSAGRFGVRYGQRIKRKIAEVESKQRKKQVCPFCKKRAKRLSKGIWECRNCGKKFAGHAYYLEEGAMIVKQDYSKELSKEVKEPKKIKEPKAPKTSKKSAKSHEKTKSKTLKEPSASKSKKKTEAKAEAKSEIN